MPDLLIDTSGGLLEVVGVSIDSTRQHSSLLNLGSKFEFRRCGVILVRSIAATGNCQSSQLRIARRAGRPHGLFGGCQMPLKQIDPRPTVEALTLRSTLMGYPLRIAASDCPSGFIHDGLWLKQAVMVTLAIWAQHLKALIISVFTVMRLCCRA